MQYDERFYNLSKVLCDEISYGEDIENLKQEVLQFIFQKFYQLFEHKEISSCEKISIIFMEIDDKREYAAIDKLVNSGAIGFFERNYLLSFENRWYPHEPISRYQGLAGYLPYDNSYCQLCYKVSWKYRAYFETFDDIVQKEKIKQFIK